MLNLNNVQQSDAPAEFSLIPHGTVCRAVMVVKMGDMEIPEFGNGMWFKQSQSSKAKWMELEFTVLGGDFDRRKFWDRIFVDGDKMNDNGVPMAKEIGLSTLRKIIDSAYGLDPTDMSEAAQQRRNISGVNDLNAMEICAKVGVKKGTNGYSDQNKLLVALTPADREYIGANQTPPVQTPSASQPQAAPAQNGAAPSWANR
jgi:hypothetical protein